MHKRHKIYEGQSDCHGEEDLIWQVDKMILGGHGRFQMLRSGRSRCKTVGRQLPESYVRHSWRFGAFLKLVYLLDISHFEELPGVRNNPLQYSISRVCYGLLGQIASSTPSTCMSPDRTGNCRHRRMRPALRLVHLRCKFLRAHQTCFHQDEIRSLL